jgi:hypothetical protein
MKRKTSRVLRGGGRENSTHNWEMNGTKKQTSISIYIQPIYVSAALTTTRRREKIKSRNSNRHKKKGSKRLRSIVGVARILSFSFFSIINGS